MRDSLAYRAGSDDVDTIPKFISEAEPEGNERSSPVYRSGENGWTELCTQGDVLFHEKLIEPQDARRLLHLYQKQFTHKTRYGSDFAEEEYPILLKRLTDSVDAQLEPWQLKVVENHIIRKANDGIGWHQDGYTSRDEYTLIVFLNKVEPKDMTKFAVNRRLRSGRGLADSDAETFEFIWPDDETFHNCLRPPACHQEGCAVLFRGLVFHGVDPGDTYRWVLRVVKRQ